MAEVVVVGGSVTGLACALACRRAGHRVTVLEADATPLPDTPSEAWWSWDRRGAPQSRHTHVLLARLRNLIRDNAPEMRQELLAIGAVEYSFREAATNLFTDPVFVPGDDDLVMLSCRRVTFEYVLRRHVEALGDVRFLTNARVNGLLADERAPVHVTGVAADHGGTTETITADIVLDASGRRSSATEWLAAAGGNAADG